MTKDKDKALDAVANLGPTPYGGFQWRSKDGTFHELEGMETRHLWFAFRLVWNHSVPPEGRMWPYEEYELDAFYSLDYRMLAIQHMSTELMRRYNWRDMLPEWRGELKEMVAYLLTVEKLKNAAPPTDPPWKKKEPKYDNRKSTTRTSPPWKK